MQAGLLAATGGARAFGICDAIDTSPTDGDAKTGGQQKRLYANPARPITLITGALARNYGHLLRAQHDVILTGSGTVRADDPSLDCRLPGMTSASPQIAIMSRDGKLTEACKLAQKRRPSRCCFIARMARPRRKPFCNWLSNI